MTRAWLLVLGIMLGLGASWLWRAQDVHNNPAPASSVADKTASMNDGERRRAPSRASTPAHLHLEPAARALADIESQALPTASVHVEQTASGRVLDGGQLLAGLRERRAARGALDAQQDLLASQRARLERLRGFAARGEIAVARELNALEMSVRREADIATSRAAQLGQSEAALQARWGASLPTADGLEATLAAGGAQLVEFAAPLAPSEIFVASDEQRDKAVAARVLGAAPTAMGTAPAATWVALGTDASLRVGMRVSVWIPQGERIASGTLLPLAALVWHAGVQWFYVETAAGEFERRRLPAAITHDLGMIVSAGVAHSDRVVVRGAQALLAEELRQRIPSEEDDD